MCLQDVKNVPAAPPRQTDMTFPILFVYRFPPVLWNERDMITTPPFGEAKPLRIIVFSGLTSSSSPLAKISCQYNKVSLVKRALKEYNIITEIYAEIFFQKARRNYGGPNFFPIKTFRFKAFQVPTQKEGPKGNPRPTAPPRRQASKAGRCPTSRKGGPQG
jgi:hypothetical protein